MRWKAFILANTFLISMVCQMVAMGDLFRLRSVAPMERGLSCCETPEEAPESADEHADEAGDWFERLHHSVSAGMYLCSKAALTDHSDENPAGISPSGIEPPPPEC
jgi:hypothetical protein